MDSKRSATSDNSWGHVFCIGFLLLLLTLLSRVGLPEGGFRWTSYILCCSGVALLLLKNSAKVEVRFGRYLDIVGAIVLIAYIAYFAGRSSPEFPRMILAFSALGASVALGFLVARVKPGPLDILLILALLLFTAAGWSTFRSATGWSDLVIKSPINFIYTTVAGLTLMILVSRKSHRPAPWRLFAWGILYFSVSFGFAFRSNFFTVHGSGFHWEYFAGPVRTILNGGILLWDTPSQYGFLNITLASLMPGSVSWNKIYLLQAILLTLSALIGFRLLTRGLNGPLQSGVPLAFFFLATLFLADPEFIGPQPYPSSSVLRFFPVYLSFFLLLSSGPTVSAIAWGVCSFWSAETANYLFAMNFGYLAWIVFDRRSFVDGFKFLATALGTAAAFAFCVTCYYYARWGVSPEFSLLYMYASRYATGFGSLPLNPISAGFVLIALSSSLAMAMPAENNDWARSCRKEIYVAVFMVLGLSNYFVGRAVPDNIIAISPILFLAAMRILQITNETGAYRTADRFTITAISLTLVWPILVNDRWRLLASEFKTMNWAIVNELPRPEENIIQALDTGGFGRNDDGILFYGNSARPLLIAKDNVPVETKLCIPAPLQLFEEPIPPVLRDKMLERYFARNPPKRRCWLVIDPDHNADRLKTWIQILSIHYTSEQVSPDLILMHPKGLSL